LIAKVGYCRSADHVYSRVSRLLDENVCGRCCSLCRMSVVCYSSV